MKTIRDLRNLLLAALCALLLAVMIPLGIVFLLVYTLFDLISRNKTEPRRG